MTPARHRAPPFKASRGRFDWARLPDPEGFYRFELGAVMGSGKWRSALCCFHPDSHPSLRVNLVTGAYRCMACGEGGSDLIAFLRRRDGLSFPDACRRLGAWVEGEQWK